MAWCEYTSRLFLHYLSEPYQVKYIFRRVPSAPGVVGSGFIRLRDGDEIHFGKGADGSKLGKGPSPSLCNLHLSVARVLKMSGAADLIRNLMEDAEDADADFCPIFHTSEDFSNTLTAKLLVTGRGIIV